jgi:hypothetical protein
MKWDTTLQVSTEIKNPACTMHFFGFDRPRPEFQLAPKYEMYDTSGHYNLLHNGRNDIAEPVIKQHLEQVRTGSRTRFHLLDLNEEKDWVRFSDFVMRFASEITPEVGPPFKICLINPLNGIETIINPELRPIEIAVVNEKLEKLGKAISG